MKKFYLFFFLFSLNFISFSQNPGDITQSFGNVLQFDSAVHCINIQNDGKILVVGDFSSFNGIRENRIIRLNENGTKDTSFITNFFPFYASIKTIYQQTDGKILVGGDFNSQGSIKRLNANGTIDTTFNSGTGFNTSVNKIIQQNDGKILVVGDFTSYNNFNCNGIIRLNIDGTIDTTFTIGSGFDEGGTGITIQQQTDGKLLVGGYFDSYNGIITGSNIIRLNNNGTIDTSFTTGAGFDNNGIIYVIQQQTDEKLLVGGDFITYNGLSEKRLIRLNLDGSKDTSFNLGTGFNSQVRSIDLQADNKILVGGSFTTFNNVIENRIIRLNANGSKDSNFESVDGFNSSLLHVELQNDGKILIGGVFWQYNDFNNIGFIRLNSNGSKDNSFCNGNGFDGKVRVIKQQLNNKILIGGAFTSYNGNEVVEKRIVCLNSDGTKDITFNTGIGFNNDVYAIEIQQNGKILIGGDFTSFNGNVENRIIRLNDDGTKDNSFNIGTGFNNLVYSLKCLSDGKILVGGSFTTCNGIVKNRIVRLNIDGTIDTTFNSGTGFSGDVRAIEIQHDGKILIGGSFNTYNGINHKRLVRLNIDGSVDPAFNTGTGLIGSVFVIKTHVNNKILIGGLFNSYNSVPVRQLFRLNTDGSIDSAFVTGIGPTSQIYSLEIQPDSKILVGGSFGQYTTGGTESCIVRLNPDGTKDTSFLIGSGIDNGEGIIHSISMLENGEILIGGGFTSYQGNNSSMYIVGLHSELSILNEISILNETLVPIIFPNPVNNELNIHTNKNINSVKIYNLQGKPIIEDSKETINVSNLSKGMYIVKIITEEGESTKKFIKE